MDIYSQLRRDEDEKLFPYKDTRGKTTIGVGRNLTDRGIRQTESELMLTNDVAEVRAALEASLAWFNSIDEPRQGVLCNMAFNLGVHGLLGFHRALNYMSEGDWNAAAVELEGSTWAGQVGARATRLAAQLRTNAWQ